jgi:hypothetical protein
MKARRILLVMFVAAALWGSYRAYRAHLNLVTLTVRNMDVRKVVSKLEWQTWEHIVLNTNVTGRVTLSVRNVPLEEVLNIVGLQTDSRWTRLYPIFSTKQSIAAFNQVLRGERVPAGSGWSALQQLAAWQRVGLGGFADTLRAENKLVSAELRDKDITFTALALSRFSKAQVVPEDGVKATVNLKLQQVPFDRAVAKVAKQVYRNWDRLYTLQPLNVANIVRKQSVPAPGTNGPVRVVTNQVVVPPVQETLAPTQALEAIVSTMTPEERQQTLDQLASANQAAALSPAERQQQMQSPSSPLAEAARASQADLETRISNRLKNGTVDQRVAHDRRQLLKQQAGPKQ